MAYMAYWRKSLVIEIGSLWFWSSLVRILGTNLNLNNAYHPKIDAQIERTNRILVDMLKMYEGNK